MSATQQQQHQQQRTDHARLEMGMQNLLDKATPTTYSVTGLRKIDGETITIPIIFIITTAISMVVMQVWQAFFVRQFHRVGFDIFDGSFLTTFVATVILLTLSIFMAQVVQWIAKRAVETEPEEWDDSPDSKTK